MKKLTILVFLVAGIAAVTCAQSFKEGTNIISAGIGLGSTLGSYTYSSQTPALSLQYERGVWEVDGPGVISVGGYLGIKSYKYSDSYSDGYANYNYTEKWNYTIIGVRSAYHYTGLKKDKFDIYGGVMLSYDILSYKYNENGVTSGGTIPNYGSGMGFSLYAGGRYYFASNFAAFAELGYGISFLNLGVELRF